MVIEEAAPAKINLALHVLGRKADGLHEIDSLVVFADCGERVSLVQTGQPQLQVSGRFANDLACDKPNMVRRAASLVKPPDGIGFKLQKEIPVGAGLGGGSSDAAAVFRLLNRQSGCAIPSMSAMAELGSDIPVCLFNQPARIRGIGSNIHIVGSMPRLPLVLVNPGVNLSTAAVYGELDTGFQEPLDPLPGNCSTRHMLAWMSYHENGLLAPAVRAAPEIGDVLNRLSSLDGCCVARMSGSGTTCFGAFVDIREANRSADLLKQEQPNWWVQSVVTSGAISAH